VAEVAPSEDEETCTSLVFKRKRKADAATLVPSNSDDRAPSYRECPPAPTLLTTSWCKRAEVKVLQRETSETLLMTYLPSYNRCCALPELKGGERIWRRIPWWSTCRGNKGKP